mgnify:CR=1 FL=1
MGEARLYFGPFMLDRAGRRLLRGNAPVEVSPRYFDALCLLLAAPGELVTKDRFMDEVWRGIPVTDEALTQCIRALRRALGDDAAAPRYIATVPKHGYRFVADVGTAPAQQPLVTPAPVPAPVSAAWWPIILGGTIGGLVAGLAGGLAYGFAAIASAPPGTVGGTSILLVMVAVTAAIAALGAAGVSIGMAFAHRRASAAGRVAGAAFAVGGALGGLIVGAVTELIGADALALLFGGAPAHMTGAGEGVLLGGGVGLALWITARVPAGLRTAAAALIGAMTGLLITALGGRLFAGSLAALTDRFAGSRMDFAALGALVGEDGLGPRALALTAVLESALFAAAICWAIRRFTPAAPP